MNMLSNKSTPLEKVVNKLEETQQMFDKMNLHIAKGVVKPIVSFAKDQLLEEKVRDSEQYQKGYNEGVKSGKLEASVTKI